MIVLSGDIDCMQLKEIVFGKFCCIQVKQCCISSNILTRISLIGNPNLSVFSFERSIPTPSYCELSNNKLVSETMMRKWARLIK